MSKMMDLVKEHVAAEDRCDVDAVMATFTDDCIYKIPAFGVDLRGKEQTRGFYAEEFKTFPDFRALETTYWECGTDVFLKVRHAYTITGEWNGIEPPPEKVGTEMQFWALAHFPEADDGMLLGENIWINGNELLANFGVLPSADVFEVAKGFQTPIVGSA